jgi:hypothetical protein
MSKRLAIARELTRLAREIMAKPIVKWDNAFMSAQDAAPLGDRRFKYKPYHEFNLSEQNEIRRMYPHGGHGAKYNFVFEHYHYPVGKNGKLGRGRRVLAIPYKLILDESYMAGLGYEVDPAWRGGSQQASK